MEQGKKGKKGSFQGGGREAELNAKKTRQDGRTSARSTMHREDPKGGGPRKENASVF